MLFQTRKARIGTLKLAANLILVLFVCIVYWFLVVGGYMSDGIISNFVQSNKVSTFVISLALILILVLIIMSLMSFKTDEEKSDEFISVLNKNIYSNFDKICFEISEVIKLYCLHREKDFYSKWNLGSPEQIKSLMKNVRQFILKKSESREMFEFVRIIEICLKYIAITLEEEKGLFDQLKEKNEELEEKIRKGRESSLSRKDFSSLNTEIGIIESKIAKAKEFFESLTHSTGEVHLPVFYPTKYKYRHYYAFIIQSESYLNMTLEQILAKEIQEHMFVGS